MVLATWKSIRRIVIRGQPQAAPDKNVRPHLKNKTLKSAMQRTVAMDHVMEHLPSRHETQNSNSSTAKKKGKEF
jgi:hypothetical protein